MRSIFFAGAFRTPPQKSFPVQSVLQPSANLTSHEPAHFIASPQVWKILPSLADMDRVPHFYRKYSIVIHRNFRFTPQSYPNYENISKCQIMRPSLNSAKIWHIHEEKIISKRGEPFGERVLNLREKRITFIGLSFLLGIIAFLAGIAVLIYAEDRGKVFDAVTNQDLISLVINGGGSSDFSISSLFNIFGAAYHMTGNQENMYTHFANR